MTHSPTPGASGGSPVEFRRLLVQLGIAMVAAGDAVDIIEESLRRIVAAFGVDGLQIALLPTSLFVQTGTGDSAHVQFSSQVAPPLRLAPHPFCSTRCRVATPPRRRSLFYSSRCNWSVYRILRHYCQSLHRF